MAHVYVSLGSNIEPAYHVQAGVAALRTLYDELQLSSVYESAAVGFSGANFYNLVVAFHTADSVYQVNDQLRAIEDAHHRQRDAQQKFNPRTLDLDLLLYDDLILDEAKLQLPRDEILKYGFVLLPLAEIAPQACHPQTGQRYMELWAALQPQVPPLWQVDVEL